MKRAVGRFRHAGLFSCFRKWVRRTPKPVYIDPEEVRHLERQLAEHMVDLKKEREAHAATSAVSKWQAVKDTAMLRALVRELQNVLAQAMRATSWARCREVLYHESCRYLPEAATHGKSMTPKLRKTHSMGSTSGGLVTARLTTGNDIHKLVPSSSSGSDAHVLRDNSPPKYHPPPSLAHEHSKSDVKGTASPQRPSQTVGTPAHRPPPPRPSTSSGRLSRETMLDASPHAPSRTPPAINVQHSLHDMRLQLDASSTSIQIEEALREMIITNAVRVIDLFREWDTNNDGSICKREFRAAISRIGSTANGPFPREAVDALFDSMDSDFNGKLEYADLNRKLRRGASIKIDDKLLPSNHASSVAHVESGPTNKAKRAPAHAHVPPAHGRSEGQVAPVAPPSSSSSWSTARLVRSQSTEVMEEARTSDDARRKGAIPIAGNSAARARSPPREPPRNTRAEPGRRASLAAERAYGYLGGL
jgi:hypothetical protein